MGFWKRLGNLWKGFLSIWISDIEKEHPEIAYQNSIESMIEKYTRLKKATAALIKRREALTERYKQRSAQLVEVTAAVDVAVDGGQDELALVVLQQKNALETEVTEIRQELEAATTDSEEAKKALLEVQAEIGKLKAEKDRMLAKMQSAKARIQIQEQLEGLSVDAEVKALDGVRDHIQNLVAEANLGKELHGASLDTKLKELRAQTGNAMAQKQLNELKAKRAAQAAAAKTM